VHLPRLTVLATAVVAFSTACGGQSAQPQSAPSSGGPASVSPAPVRTVVKNSRVVDAGRAVPFRAQRGVTLRLRASSAEVSRSSLSANYGYPPSHGFYVTFRLTITNTGSKSVQIGPSNFVVVIPGEGRVTSYDGNAPFSGAPRQLDTTQITPGEVLHGPLSFDVRTPHGRLQFVPDTSAAIVWRF